MNIQTLVLEMQKSKIETMSEKYNVTAADNMINIDMTFEL